MSLPEPPHQRPHLNRRTILGFLAASAATAATSIGRAEAQPTAAMTPTARPRTLSQPGGVTGMQQPGFAVDTVGIRWPHTTTGGGRIRFIDQHGDIGPWHAIPMGCPAGAGDTVPGGTAAALIPAGRARAYEVDLPSGATTVALNTTDGPALPRPPAAATELAGGVYLSRAAWGADESLRFDQTGVERFPPTYWPVQTVTVHHTATGNNDPDPAARVRAIYRFQTVDEDFGDIGYHFLIDEAGRIYEGRWSGTDRLPGFNPAGLMVNAAHVAGFNAGNVGIALLGTFTDQPPTPAAQRTLTLLLAAMLAWHHLDPVAATHYINPISGATRTVATVPGHRDWASTLCPGDQLANQLPTIRTTIAHLVSH